MKDALLKIRLTADEKSFIRQQAEAAGIPVSAYVRTIATGNVIRTKTDASILNELTKLHDELLRQGGLCKHLWQNGVDPAATGAALEKLKHAATVVEQTAARLAPK